jgi:ankyrin repeat protein
MKMSKQPIPVEQIREFVIAAHSDLSKVKSLLAENPEYLNTFYAWSESDHESAIMAAAHMGNKPIAEYLIALGAPMEICTAAMLGRTDEVRAELSANPALIHARGAHQIPLLAHAALGGSVELVQMLVTRGAQEGLAFALGNAVMLNDEPLARWLLENTKPDLAWKNWEQTSVLSVAEFVGNDALTTLLLAHGATK